MTEQQRNAALLKAAAHRTPTEVEAALGRFRRGPVVEAARAAAGAALSAGRWDNLLYLADFLHDVTSAHPPTGGSAGCGGEGESGDEDSREGEGESGIEEDRAAETGILSFVVGTAGADYRAAGGPP